MDDSLESIFRTDYMPHGHCYLWKPEILWLNIVSDSLIALAYFSIPVALYYIVEKRTDMEFRGIFILFSAFIFMCGITHMFSIYTIYTGAYGIHGIIKFLTAIISCLTAYRLYQNVPLALDLPSPSELKKAYKIANQAELERVQLENEKQQEVLIRESTDSAHIGILVVDENGSIKMANEASCQIFGYTKSEFEGSHLNFLLPKEARNHHTLLIEKFFEADESEIIMASDRIVTGVTKEGNRIPIEVRLNKRIHGDKRLVFASFQDISERLKVAKQLKDSETTLRSIINALPLGMHVLEMQDNELKLTDCNQTALEVLRQSRTDIVGKGIADAYPGIKDTELEKTYRDIALYGGVFHNESVEYNHDGTDGIFDVQCFQSKVGTAIILFQDVTTKKWAEKSIKEKDRFINTAFNASITGVYIYNLLENKIDFINETYTTITGYTLYDIGLIDNELFLRNFHPDEQNRMQNHLKSLLVDPLNTERKPVEYRFKHKDGHWIWCLGQDVILDRDDSGKVTRFMGSFIDISNQKELQHNLVELKESAEKANLAKSEFLANMSHEIRTPMNAILGLTSLVLQMDITQKQEDYLSKVVTSSTSLLHILNDILDYSKMEAGKLNIVEEPFNLRSLIENGIGLFTLNLEQKSIAINVLIHDELKDYYRGDPLRINQILNNLIGNAIKFTTRGSISIEAKIEDHALSNQDYDTINISVKDTGIGMSSEQVSMLFEPFNQADTSIMRKYGGTGLGLTICKTLAAMMNGEIKVESQKNVGSCFSLCLPLKALNEQEIYEYERSTYKDGLGSDEEKLQLRAADNTTALLVEDNVTNQLVAEEFLGLLNVKVVIAENGLIALEKFEQAEFDIVFMDIQMPVMDGLTAASKLRQTQKGKHIPIIAMSAAVLQSDVEKVKSVGMNDHIAKPIDMNALSNIVQRYLKTKSQLQSDDKKGDKRSPLFDYPELDSLDVNDALARIMQNEQLYLRLLKSFIVDAASSSEHLTIAYNDHNNQAIYKIAHKLKGLSGSIGASRLQALCVKLEEQTTEEQVSKDKITKISEVKDLLEDTIEKITLFLSREHVQVIEESKKAARVAANTIAAQEDIFTGLVSLKTKLDGGSFMAMDDVYEIVPSIEQVFDDAELNNFVNCINHLNYEDAIRLINKVLLEYSSNT